MSAYVGGVELSKRAIRDRAIGFSDRWKGATSESAERQLFWNDFFSVFGVALRRIGFFEVAAKRLSTGNRGWIDLLVPGEMAVEHKSAGEDLGRAMDQLVDYLDSLQAVAMPRLLVACNFQEFMWRDLETNSEGKFPLSDLSHNVELFWWLSGHQRQETIEDEEEANLVATGLMAKVHDAVLESGYDAHALREWLTRILFCLFADDTDVWERNAFSNYLFLNTRPDGSDLGPEIALLFQILNTPEPSRSTNLDEDLAAFTYINGDIFASPLPIPSCNEATRNALLQACKFDWSAISPAIFGSMFQNVMTAAERRKLGAHYTSEENILKTIRPLFLDELEEELKKIKVTSSAQSRSALTAFHDKLASIKFLDPACGCGNFLVIAYRELRRLETELLRKRAVATGQQMNQVMDITHQSKVTVGQFYGVELEEFPARIARTALYLMDHQENLKLSRELGRYFARFPIPTSPHIVIGNALQMDWNDVLPVSEATVVCGNPPFVGSRMASPEQKIDQEHVWKGNKRQGTLDFVTNWFKIAAEYVAGTPVRVAFVSTNSITQGEQPATLWKELWRHQMEIDFAHRTFAWTSEAKGKAAVHVVIIGFSCVPKPSKRSLWIYQRVNGPGQQMEVGQINPYLTDAPNVVIGSRQGPLVGGIPPMLFGSMPRDNGHLSNISEEEALRIQNEDPLAAKYLRKLVGADELLNGSLRYCLWLVDADPTDVARSDVLQQRLRAVREMRLASKAESTRRAAATPSLFVQLAQPDGSYLAVPRVSSESRAYLPTAFFEKNVIASDALLTIPGAEETLFGIISSKAFTAWNRTISGRLKSDMRVSQEITYNNFPWLERDDPGRPAISKAALDVLKTRSAFPTATLSALYNPIGMPPPLVEAHKRLDGAVLKAYGIKLTATEPEILSKLLTRYEALSAPLLAGRP
jgi:N-6 DNA Methylase